MASFYEVIVRIPSDIEEHLPGIPDAFVDWIAGKEWELPECSDMDATLIDHPQLTIAEKVQREFLNEWQKIVKSEPQYFVQFEKGDRYFHLHTLVETTGMKSMVLGRYLNQIKDKLRAQIYRGVEPQIPDWMAVSKTKTAGANRIRDKGYIPAYLLPKRQPELQWAWTNMEEYIRAALSLEERSRLVEEFKQDSRAVATSDSQQSQGSQISGNPRWRGRAVDKYMDLVSWLVERGITSEREWIREDQDSYLSHNATSAGRSSIKAALDNASRIMATTKCARDYLVGPDVPQDISRNRIWKIFNLNSYDPKYAGSILLGWCNKEYGKRNTVWLFGPATTGKTNIAEAIAHAVPFYGCVNWTNENFPFNDCVDKMVIWWEEGKMTAKVVESAKAILGGSMVRVDQKCKASQQIEQTPVIVTSNTNMCAVIDGNSTTFEHQQPLEDRMFKFELTRRLGPDFGKISKREVREFFAWADANRVPINHEFRVRKLMTLSTLGKRPAPEGEEPPEGINRAKKARTAPLEPRPSEEQHVSNYALRYVNKCSRHLSMSEMMFPCQICERMNYGQNVCFTHGQKDCNSCFPDGQESASLFSEASEGPESDPDLRCNTCKMRGRNIPNCILCAEVKEAEMMCIDDLNKEQ